ncbi:hypothetical protein ACE3LF_25105 [Enterobacter hormaechei subsp. xiangfangensis]
MSTTLKEWLLKTIAELEEERDATPGAVNEDAAMALAAMKLALASIEAEAVAWIVHARTGDQLTADGDYVANAEGILGLHSTPLYTDPPAPVSVPDELSREEYKRRFMEENDFDNTFRGGWNACRAAMLQGADQAPVKQPSSNSIVGWLRADYQDDNRGLRGNAPLFVLGKKDPSTVWGLDYIPLTSNSPVIPDGVCPCCGRKQLKNRTCSVSGCDGKHVARGFCVKHFALERKKDPSRRESIRAADKRYRARKAAATKQEVK